MQEKYEANIIKTAEHNYECNNTEDPEEKKKKKKEGRATGTIAVCQ